MADASEFLVQACGNSPNAERNDGARQSRRRLNSGGSSLPHVTYQFREAALDYMQENLKHELDPSEVFDGVDYGDTDTAESNAKQLITERLARLGISPGHHELMVMIDAYDLEERLISGIARSPICRGPE